MANYEYQPTTLISDFDLKTLPPLSTYDRWIANPRQTEVLKRREREVLYGGARGGGKTEVGQVWLLEYLDDPRFRGLVIRQNAEDLFDWVERIKDFYAPIPGIKITGKPVVIRKHNGGVIRAGHLKDDDAYRKYLGANYTKILIEELTLLPTLRQYEMLISTLRSSIAGLEPQLLATTNPGNAGHLWVKNYFVELADGKTYYDEFGASRIFIRSSVFDNPHLVKNDPMYVQKLRGYKDENLRKAWLYGDWDVFIGQFFTMWNPEIHVKSSAQIKISPEWKRYRSIDPAFRNPTSCLWAAVDEEGNIYIYREMLESELTTTVASQYIHELSGSEQYVSTVIDPSSKAPRGEGTSKSHDHYTRQSERDIFHRNGIYTTLANNDRVNGWKRIKDLLYFNLDKNTKPRLYIMETCPLLISHIPAANYHDTIPDDINQKELDGHYHWDDLDALRYLVMHIYGRTIIKHDEPQTSMSKLITKLTKRKTTALNPWAKRQNSF